MPSPPGSLWAYDPTAQTLSGPAALTAFRTVLPPLGPGGSGVVMRVQLVPFQCTDTGAWSLPLSPGVLVNPTAQTLAGLIAVTPISPLPSGVASDVFRVVQRVPFQCHARFRIPVLVK